MKPTHKRTLLFVAVALTAGVAIGGFAFQNVQPRSWLAFRNCGSDCYRPADLVGVLASVGIRDTPEFLPGVVRESATCIAVRYPIPGTVFHVVLFPKRDIRDITDITPADEPYVMGCFAMIRRLVQDYRLRAYRVVTNGPALQDITYLHFHLMTVKPKPWSFVPYVVSRAICGERAFSSKVLRGTQ